MVEHSQSQFEWCASSQKLKITGAVCARSALSIEDLRLAKELSDLAGRRRQLEGMKKIAAAWCTYPEVRLFGGHVLAPLNSRVMDAAPLLVHRLR